MRPRVLDVVEGDRGPRRRRTRSSSRGTDGAIRRPGERATVLGEGRLHVVAGADRRERLDLAGDLRREEVRLAVAAEPGEAGIGQAGLATGRRLGQGGRGVAASKLALGEIGEGRPAGPRGGHREAARDDRRVEVHDIDEGATDIRRDRADAHPRQGLAQAGFEGERQALDGVGGGQVLGAARAGQFGGQLDGEPRVDGRGAGRDDHRHRVDVEDVRRLDEQVRPAAQAGGGQGGVDGTDREDRRDRQRVGAERAVAQDQDLDAGARGRDGVVGEAVQGAPRGPAAPPTAGQVVVEPTGPDPGGTQRAEEAVEVDDDRPCQANGPWPARRTAEQGRPTTQLHPQVHDRALALRVDRRVRDLGERLAKVIGDGPVEPPAAGGRRVVAHAPQRLVGLEGHRLDVEAGALGVEAGQVAQPRWSSAGRASTAAAAASARSSWVGPWLRRGSAASAGPRPSRRRPRGSRGGAARRGGTGPGPRRPRRTVSAAVNGIAPASEATPDDIGPS